tara:strand:- start:990 stop:1244 length:255 start_codon:yes stop_codon:yes gene_type:complete
MNKLNFKKALRFIAEEKAFLHFEILEGEELNFNNPDQIKYINENIESMKDVFRMYGCYPKESKIKTFIKKEWEFINNLIKDLKQ